MKTTWIGAVAGCLLALAASAAVETYQASPHPMRYHLALPDGWSAERAWPVLVVIPDASRDFAGDLSAFVTARGKRPYILVSPEVLTCGGARARSITTPTSRPSGIHSSTSMTSASTKAAWPP